LFAGSRPSVTPAQPEVHYGTPLDVTTPAAAGIATAALMRPGATTHSSDLEQRLIDVPSTVTGPDTLRLQMPASANLAPPGWYLLFVVDQAGVPSPAAWVHLT
jgi:hypothetical protein